MGIRMAECMVIDNQRRGLLELHACAAATGRHLAAVLLPAGATVSALCQAVAEERQEDKGDECSYHLVMDGSIPEASTPLGILGLQNGAMVDMVRCRPGSVMTASSDGTAKVFSAETGTCTLTLPGHAQDLRTRAFSPDGLRSVLFNRREPTVKITKVATGKCLLTLTGHRGPVNAATFSPEGYHVATASSDRTARVWNARTGECVRTLAAHTSDVLFVAFSPDGRRVVTTSDDGSARIWSIATGSCMRTLEGHKWGVNTARFSPDGCYVATASDERTAKVWNAETGECVQTLEGHKSPVVDVTFGGCWNP